VLTSGAAPSTLTVSVKALECKFLAHRLTGAKIDALGGFNVQRIGADAQEIEAEPMSLVRDAAAPVFSCMSATTAPGTAARIVPWNVAVVI
jgi:hypothetical protein